MDTPTLQPFAADTRFVVETGSVALGVAKHNYGTISLVQELGPEYSHQVRVILTFTYPLKGSRAGQNKIVLYATHKNRLSEPLLALHGMISGQKIVIRRKV